MPVATEHVQQPAEDEARASEASAALERLQPTPATPPAAEVPSSDFIYRSNLTGTLSTVFRVLSLAIARRNAPASRALWTNADQSAPEVSRALAPMLGGRWALAIGIGCVVGAFVRPALDAAINDALAPKAAPAPAAGTP